MISPFKVVGESCSDLTPYSQDLIDKDHKLLCNRAARSFHPTTSHERFLQVIDKELIYFSEMEKMLLEVPEYVCSVDPRLLQYIRNSDCWNGTALGRYNSLSLSAILYFQILLASAYWNPMCGQFSMFTACSIMSLLYPHGIEECTSGGQCLHTGGSH